MVWFLHIVDCKKEHRSLHFVFIDHAEVEGYSNLLMLITKKSYAAFFFFSSSNSQDEIGLFETNELNCFYSIICKKNNMECKNKQPQKPDKSQKCSK